MQILGWIGFALGVIFSAVDAYLTAMILNRGGKEKNPVLRWCIKTFGSTLGLGVPKLASVAVVAWAIYSFPQLWWSGPAMAVAFGYISKRNYYVLTLLK